LRKRRSVITFRQIVMFLADGTLFDALSAETNKKERS
jgi:hypothetical protein